MTIDLALVADDLKKGNYVSFLEFFDPGLQPENLYTGKIVQQVIFEQLQAKCLSDFAANISVKRILERARKKYPALSISTQELDKYDLGSRPDIVFLDNRTTVEISSVDNMGITRARLKHYLSHLTKGGFSCEPGDTTSDLFKAIILIPNRIIVVQGYEPGLCAYAVIPQTSLE